jgi:hypothetical protein
MGLGSYSLRRLSHMCTWAAVAVLVACLLGFREAAWGIVAGTPVGLFNYLLSYFGLQKALSTRAEKVSLLLVGSTIFRLLIDMAVLVLAVKVGVQFVLGVLLGLLMELVTHYVDIICFVALPHRGERRAREGAATRERDQ